MSFARRNAQIKGGVFRQLPHSWLPASYYRLFWPIVHQANARVKPCRSLDATARAGQRYTKDEAIAAVCLDVHAGRRVSLRQYAYLWNVPVATAQGWLRKIVLYVRHLVRLLENHDPGDDWKALQGIAYTKAPTYLEPAAGNEALKHTRWRVAAARLKRVMHTHLSALQIKIRRILKTGGKGRIARTERAMPTDRPLMASHQKPRHITAAAKSSISWYFNPQTNLKL
jgi:hypothetical protein